MGRDVGCAVGPVGIKEGIVEGIGIEGEPLGFLEG